MIRNPIHKVLSTLNSHQVRYLLAGGQACILYGAAEFSRDTDILVVAEPANLERLAAVVAELQAEPIAVPPFEIEYLLRGHAVHFRCRHPDCDGIRIDVMSVMRGLAPFDELWVRRQCAEVAEGQVYVTLGIRDLIASKKTQRDKDWPMIRRLVEAHFVQHRDEPTQKNVAFWLREARTPALLIQLAQNEPDALPAVEKERPLLQFARAGDEHALAEALEQEAKREREADRRYWEPLRQELEQLRHRK